MLKISPTLELPLSAVTQRSALLAVSGAGKSNAARAMAEEFHAAKLPFVAIDPKGDWWGLRAGSDGRPKGGLDIVIFGGGHGDIPLERTGGALVADTIVDQRLSCVVDLSGFESQAAKQNFLFDFGSRLYHRNRDPLHVFCEECDDYLPQKPMREQVRLLAMFENFVRRGRTRGLGITLITQRAAVVNKNVLTQVETLYALRTSGPQDIKAIEAWMQYHGANREMLSTLATLADGEAWVWSPHFLKKTERFRFRRSHTFDSGATPTNHTASSRRAPATLADVDLAALKERMAETIERVTADDPKALRKRIAELERQLSQKKPDDGALAENVRWAEWARGVEGELNRRRRKTESALASLRSSITDATSASKQLEEQLERGMEGLPEPRPFEPASVGYDIQPTRVVTSDEHGQLTQPARRMSIRAHGELHTYPPGEGGLGKCSRQLLAALLQHGDLSLEQAAIIGGYAPSSGGVRNSAGKLRKLMLVEGSNAAMTANERLVS